MNRKLMDFVPQDSIRFEERFKDRGKCAEYLMSLRWPDGFVCPRCGGRIGQPTHRGTFSCSDCKRQTSVTSKTALHRSHIPLPIWFRAMWLACTQRTGLTAAGLQQRLGLGSYRSALTMLHKLRKAMGRVYRRPLRGVVQVAEIHLGGKELKGDVGGQNLADKALVVVAVELDRKRKTRRVRLRHISSDSAENLMGFVRKVVKPGTIVCTDDNPRYTQLTAAGYRHRVRLRFIKTDRAIPVFWEIRCVASQLRRWLVDIHRSSVSPQHLQRYLNQFAFRLNRRRSKQVGEPFRRLATQLVRHPSKAYRRIIGAPGKN